MQLRKHLPKRRLAVIFAVGILLGILGTLIFVEATISPTTPITFSAGPYPGAPNYTIYPVTYSNGTVEYRAKDQTGAISWSSTNASSVIQSALNSGSGTVMNTVQFTGTVTIGNQLNIPSYTHLAGPAKLIWATGSPTTQNMLDYGNSTHIIIENLELDGNKAGQTSGANDEYQDAIHGQAASYITVQNNYIHDTTIGGIIASHVSVGGVDTGVSYMTIKGNTFRNIGINDATFGQDAVHFHLGSNAIVTDNIMDNIIGIGVYLIYHPNSVVANNQINNTRSYGVWLNTLSSDSLIENNQLLNNGNASATAAVMVTSGNNTISSNVIQTAWDYGIYIQSQYNRIADNEITVRSGSGDYGIYLVSNYNTINGNTIKNAPAAAIEVVGAKYNIITSNIIIDPGVAWSNHYYGIEILANGGTKSTNNTITQNTISSISTSVMKYGITEGDASEDWNTYSGNIIKGAGTADIITQGVNDKFNGQWNSTSYLVSAAIP